MPADGGDTASSVELGRCPVCTSPLIDPAGSGIETCPRCWTPHHTECWRFIGECSRFGCAPSHPQAPRRPTIVRLRFPGYLRIGIVFVACLIGITLAELSFEVRNEELRRPARIDVLRYDD